MRSWAHPGEDAESSSRRRSAMSAAGSAVMLAKARSASSAASALAMASVSASSAGSSFTSAAPLGVSSRRVEREAEVRHGSASSASRRSVRRRALLASRSTAPMTSRPSAAAAASSALARATAFVQAWEDRADAASASAVDRALSTESTREPSTVSSGPPLERRELGARIDCAPDSTSAARASSEVVGAEGQATAVVACVHAANSSSDDCASPSGARSGASSGAAPARTGSAGSASAQARAKESPSQVRPRRGCASRRRCAGPVRA